jgi:hypothetical protein
MPLIPAQQDVGDRADEVRAAVGVYFDGMRAYVACVQADLKAAGGDAAPTSVKTALVARNNTAVAEAQEVQKLFQERIGGGQTAKAGTEAAVRKLAEGIISGEPDYDAMVPDMARLTRQQLPNLQSMLVALGPAIQSVEFGGVGQQGHDVYMVHHENGVSRWAIGLDGEGKINFAIVRPVGKGDTAAAVRKLAEGIISGEPDYDSMTPELARATRQQLDNVRSMLLGLGSVIQGVEFGGTEEAGTDVYTLRHENGASRWVISLDGEGKINTAFVRPADAAR